MNTRLLILTVACVGLLRHSNYAADAGSRLKLQTRTDPTAVLVPTSGAKGAAGDEDFSAEDDLLRRKKTGSSPPAKIPRGGALNNSNRSARFTLSRPLPKQPLFHPTRPLAKPPGAAHVNDKSAVTAEARQPSLVRSLSPDPTRKSSPETEKQIPHGPAPAPRGRSFENPSLAALRLHSSEQTALGGSPSFNVKTPVALGGTAFAKRKY